MKQFSPNKINFTKANISHQAHIDSWLNEPHMREHWDNSPEHRQDICAALAGKELPSINFGILFHYWIGYYDKTPYAFILTHEITADHCSTEVARHLAADGKTIGLDFGIGNPEYLGVGLAAPTLQTFMQFFSSEVEPQTTTYLIDPLLKNPKAIHVYQKAGFKIKAKFTQQGGYFDQTPGVIMTTGVGSYISGDKSGL